MFVDITDQMCACTLSLLEVMLVLNCLTDSEANTFAMQVHVPRLLQHTLSRAQSQV